MTEEEAIKMLRGGIQGIAEWNKRRASGEEVSDLTGADLPGADLPGTRTGPLIGSMDTVMSANLTGLTLRRASFFGANLSFVQFRGADLSQADFQNANLTGANFVDADLTGAALLYANLHRAQFNGAKFDGVHFGQNIITVGISSADGLERSEHVSPSQISTDALLYATSPLPDVFVRGCGVPDALIDNLESLRAAMEPIQHNSCFISYTHKDEEFCKLLHSRMQDKHLRVWYAPADLKGGDKLKVQIDRAIQVHDRLLLVLSEHSMQSGWVETEIREARQREIREKRWILFPIRLVPFEAIQRWKCFDADTGRDLAREIREYFIPDFSNWQDKASFDEGFDKLLADLRKHASTIDLR